ncbi:MAG: hypothetical protein C0603_09780 [Denitrovibrio sp.]|nr:MAG: hypothetical protein C0603_09780 [Denitrovibrio sp.]
MFDSIDYYANPINLNTISHIEAAIESSKYAREKLTHATQVNSKEGVLTYSMQYAPKDGLYMEFGVYKGATLRIIASNTSSRVYGFDSFFGMPEEWNEWEQGALNLNGAVPDAPENATIVKGLFQDSLPTFLQQNNRNVSFIHIDCDLYSSTKFILDTLVDNIVPGTVIVFDEYLNHPNWKLDEYKAFQDFITKYHIEYNYLAYNPTKRSVSIQITSINQKHTFGFVYSATGLKFKQEAMLSIKSLRKQMPTTPIAIFLDNAEDFDTTLVDYYFILPEPEYGFGDKIPAMMMSPFKHNIFLDTDTYILHDLSELFALSNIFDFAATHAPIRNCKIHGEEFTGDKTCFPEYNTGVIVYQKNRATMDIFKQWQSDYNLFCKEKKIHPHDQQSIRTILSTSIIKQYVLPEEYNFRIIENVPVFARHTVKIVHGRPPVDREAVTWYDKFGNTLNKETVPRVFYYPDNIILQNLDKRLIVE